jgi:hypothetical protein
VAKKKKYLLDFEVDKLTNSIENALTGDSFQTDVFILSRADLKQVFKKEGWLFNWSKEFNDKEKLVYKLSITHSPYVIHGLMSLSIKSDHIYMHLIESAPFNKGKKKVYIGVPGNLVAFACLLSFHHGFDGNVSFHAKTNLISHYEKTLGATHFSGHLMILHSEASQKLVDKYFGK